MGFFDKVKNMFTEEVEDDVKVEKIQKEVTHVEIESPKVAESIDFDMMDEEIEEDTFSRPVFFDDNDFDDLKEEPKKEEIKEEIKEEKELYGIKMEEKKEEKKVFKPTPIISPVYGVLDKNYHKEDIVSKNEVKEEIEPSIDTIRNKAYGTLEDELENTLFGNNSVLFKKALEEEVEELERLDDDVLANFTDDISKELDELLEKKEKYIEPEEKKVEELNDDLLDFIDSTLYKEGDEE